MSLLRHFPGQDWLGVLIAIPGPWVTQPTELRLNLGNFQGSHTPAHITILPPTPFPAGKRPEVIRHLCGVAKRHSPFRVTLKGSDSFRPLSQVAFLSLSEGATECVNLTDEIRAGPLDIRQRFPYHPHVTLTQGVDDPAFGLVLDLSTNFEASWLVSGFRLNCVNEGGIYSATTLFDFEASSI